MILIVGLGNPGQKYEHSRHNLGFMVVETLLRQLTPVKKTVWKEDKRFKSLIAKVNGLVLVKPQTMMNASGFAVKKLVHFNNLTIEQWSNDLWVVHDDLDLPLGKIKIRLGGAAAGHHGVESIIEQLRTDQFVRFRLGIGKPTRGPGLSDRHLGSAEKYVLSEFGSNEKPVAGRMIKKTVEAIRFTLDRGLEKAKNRLNQ